MQFGWECQHVNCIITGNAYMPTFTAQVQEGTEISIRPTPPPQTYSVWMWRWRLSQYELPDQFLISPLLHTGDTRISVYINACCAYSDRKHSSYFLKLPKVNLALKHMQLRCRLQKDNQLFCMCMSVQQTYISITSCYHLMEQTNFI
jgi:hypothetical protein